MSHLAHLFDKNKAWAKQIKEEDPQFFNKLCEQQKPEILWIGCSDSRVPANQIVSMLPGDLFVHRNVANLVHQTDLNCLSVMQFAVEMLEVKEIIVCGHYGCGGVRTALEDGPNGLIDNWLRQLKILFQNHENDFPKNISNDEKVNKACELNVVQQVQNVCQTTVLQDAWQRGQKLTIHGWIYSIKDGLLKDLGLSINGQEETQKNFQQAVEHLFS